MSWEALLSVTIGASIALVSTLLADARRDRRQRERDHEVDRRRYGIEFMLALNAAVGALRDVARSAADPATRIDETTRAVGGSGLYGAREQLLVSGTPELLVAGEIVFHHLIDMRDAVRAGATTKSPAYHAAYHAYADSLWRFRLAVRNDLGQPALVPAALNRPDWSDRDRCSVCAESTTSD